MSLRDAIEQATLAAQLAVIGPVPAPIDGGKIAPTGGEAQRQMARFRSRIVARYKLVAVPGRPEELRQPTTDLRVSLGYACKTIRVRTQQGRTWLDWRDYRIAEGQYKALYDQLDPHFGFLESHMSSVFGQGPIHIPPAL